MNDRAEAVRVVRNLWGLELEKGGRVDDAVALYEANVDDGFDGNGPYDRLAVIYRRRKEFGHEVRVLRRAVSRFTELTQTSPRADVRPKLDAFLTRLAKAEALMDKSGQDVQPRPATTPPAIDDELIYRHLPWERPR